MVFPLRRRKSEGVEHFWKRLEAELGEPIRAYALGRYISGREESGPLWGLLYVTAGTLYFQHFAQTNWFSSIVRSGVSDEENESRSPRERNLRFEVPFQQVAELVTPEPDRFFERLFRPTEPVYRLRSVYESAPSFVFSVDNRQEEFVSELQAVLANARSV